MVGQGDSPVVDQTPAIFDVLLRGQIPYRFVDGDSAALFPPHPALALVTPEAGEATRWYGSWPTQQLANEHRLVSLDAAYAAFAAGDESALDEWGLQAECCLIEEALGVNYRLGRAEIALLGLIIGGTFGVVLDALRDIPGLKELRGKVQAPGAASTSPGAAG